MSTTSPSANKILVDLAIARESARVSAEDARTERRKNMARTRHLAVALSSEFPTMEASECLAVAERLMKIVIGLERAGS